MRTIAVVTTSRADYAGYRPLLRRIAEEPGLRLKLIVGGSHLSTHFGYTVEEIERDGFPISARVPISGMGGTPESMVAAMGSALAGFGRAFARVTPDLALVFGDRYEMFAAASAATPFSIPVAHLHGGEVTEGVLDDLYRNAMTKLSHLHFVSAPEHGRRVIALGEEPWRVTVSGAPRLDDISASAARVGDVVNRPYALITFHPETRDLHRTEAHLSALLRALRSCGLNLVFTAPNADSLGQKFLKRVRAFVASRSNAALVVSAGADAYAALLKHAAIAVGNSSSGIIEAASFRVPVVNVGDRQRGRLRSRNVIDAAPSTAAIASAIRRGLSPAFRRSLVRLKNPYGDGRAAGRIVRRLKSIPINSHLLVKKAVSL